VPPEFVIRHAAEIRGRLGRDLPALTPDRLCDGFVVNRGWMAGTFPMS
jgi:hypothetical protein